MKDKQEKVHSGAEQPRSRKSHISMLLAALPYLKWGVIAIALIAGIWVVWGIYHGVSTAEISVGSDHTINVTPEKVTEIKRIGQWEFLTVYDEQVVDTVRRNVLLSDDRMTCIYYGTMRLGIDLNRVSPDWVQNHNDTITVTLPAPQLLDENFIDEARTVVFYERGAWSARTKEQMYSRAARRMKAYGLSKANIERVRQLSAARFEALFMSLGAKKVDVQFAGG